MDIIHGHVYVGTWWLGMLCSHEPVSVKLGIARMFLKNHNDF